MSDIRLWSVTAGSNSAAPPDGAPEGSTAIPDLNDIIREMMASIRRYAQDAYWFNWGHTPVFVTSSSFRIGGEDVRSIYDVGRRVRVTGTITGTVTGTITASTFGTDTTVTFSPDSGGLSSETLQVSVGNLPGSERQRSSGETVPPGSKVMFFNSAAPAGWTFDSSQNDRYIMATSTVSQGGTTGGSHTISGGSIGSTAITTAQMPAHAHGFSGAMGASGHHQHLAYAVYGSAPPSGFSYVAAGGTAGGGTPDDQYYTYWTQAGGDHVHSQSFSMANTGSGQAHGHSLTFDGAWRGAFLRGIICTKN